MIPDSIKVLLMRIAVVGGAALFFYSGLDWRYGALGVTWAIMTWFIWRAYDNWSMFLKRCVLSLPFIAIVDISLYIFIHPEPYIYWYASALLFDALILNVSNLLPHYFTTLFGTAATIIILLIRKQYNAEFFHTYSLIFLCFFCASYLLILNHKQYPYVYIWLKATFFGMFMVLFSWLFMASNDFMGRHKVPLGFSFGFSCLLGVIFFVVFYVLAKNYFKGNNLFRKGKITEPFEVFLNNLKESVELGLKKSK